MRAGLVAALVLTFAWGACAEAQGGEQNAVERVTRAYAAAEANDAAGLASYLADDRWYVRRFAFVRLRAMGMPGETAEALAPTTRPTAAGAPAAETLAAVGVWAATVPKEKDPPAFRPVPIDAAMAICSILEEELRFAGRDPAMARGLVGGIVDLLGECPGREERAFVAQRVLADLEGDRVLKELGLPRIPDGEKEFEDACARLKTWFAENARYHYLHPGERRLRLDEAARTAKVPTDEFRSSTPWGAAEGPNAPPEREGPVR